MIRMHKNEAEVRKGMCDTPIDHVSVVTQRRSINETLSRSQFKKLIYSRGLLTTLRSRR